MPVLSIGDLANTFQTRRLSAGLKADMARLSKELSTGVKENLGAAVGGDYGPLSSLKRSLTTLRAYETTNKETAGFLGAAQTALDNIQSNQQDLSTALLAAGNVKNPVQMNAVAEDARQKLAATISALNTRFAGRSIFAGASTDRSAVANAETIMAALSATIAGETTAAGVASAVDTWFDTSGGGFDTLGYTGSVASIGPLPISENDEVSFELRADDTAIRETLKGLAMAALTAQGALSGNQEEQAILLTNSAHRLLAADTQITNLRAGVGAAQARVDNANARNSAETSAYQLALSDLIAADPYETATDLEAVYGQIETLYTATVRIARLSLTDYMR